ncbi:MAG: polysaccharide deacetylase family protein [Chloroflexota bacterium]
MTSPPGPPIINALTFDVEYWFDGFDLPAAARRALPSRLAVGLWRVLNLLDAYKVKATFFILGGLVDEWRSLLGHIAEAGHEIAVHGFRHRPIYRLTPAEFAVDLQQALQAVRTFTGRPVQSYRAPFFSITRRSLWALPLLARAGLRRDSSIVPAANPRYGIPQARREPHWVSLIDPAGRSSEPGLAEYPISTLTWGRLRLPFSGGFYARLLPYRLIHQATRQLNAQGQPVIFYFHPWELDPAQPRLDGQAPALYRFTHYYRLNSTAATLEALLRNFPFARLADLPVPATSAAYQPNPRSIQSQPDGLTGQPVRERGQEK